MEQVNHCEKENREVYKEIRETFESFFMMLESGQAEKVKIGIAELSLYYYITYYYTVLPYYCANVNTNALQLCHQYI